MVSMSTRVTAPIAAAPPTGSLVVLVVHHEVISMMTVYALPKRAVPLTLVPETPVFPARDHHTIIEGRSVCAADTEEVRLSGAGAGAGVSASTDGGEATSSSCFA